MRICRVRLLLPSPTPLKFCSTQELGAVMQCVAVCCIVLQCVAVSFADMSCKALLQTYRAFLRTSRALCGIFRANTPRILLNTRTWGSFVDMSCKALLQTYRAFLRTSRALCGIFRANTPKILPQAGCGFFSADIYSSFAGMYVCYADV